MDNKKTSGVDVKNLGKEAVAAAAEAAKIQKAKKEAKMPNKPVNQNMAAAESAAKMVKDAKAKEEANKAKEAAKVSQPAGKTQNTGGGNSERLKQAKPATQTLVISTGAVHLADIRAILKKVGLTPTETKEKQGRAKNPMSVTVDVLPDTIRILTSLKRVLGSNLPTAINRVELYPEGLVFEFFVKYGRGQIYDKRAKTTPGINCKTKPAKKQTTAGDMRSVHLVTLKIPATPFVATQVGAIWKLLKYSFNAVKA